MASCTVAKSQRALQNLRIARQPQHIPKEKGSPTATTLVKNPAGVIAPEPVNPATPLTQIESTKEKVQVMNRLMQPSRSGRKLSLESFLDSDVTPAHRDRSGQIHLQQQPGRMDVWLPLHGTWHRAFAVPGSTGWLWVKSENRFSLKVARISPQCRSNGRGISKASNHSRPRSCSGSGSATLTTWRFANTATSPSPMSTNSAIWARNRTNTTGSWCRWGRKTSSPDARGCGTEEPRASMTSKKHGQIRGRHSSALMQLQLLGLIRRFARELSGPIFRTFL